MIYPLWLKIWLGRLGVIFLIGYFIFYGLFLLDRFAALPAGLIFLPLLLFGVYLFDFGHDAAWLHGGYTP